VQFYEILFVVVNMLNLHKKLTSGGKPAHKSVTLPNSIWIISEVLRTILILICLHIKDYLFS